MPIPKTRFNRQNTGNSSENRLEQLRRKQMSRHSNQTQFDNLSRQEEYDKNDTENEEESDETNRLQEYQQSDNDIEKQQAVQQTMRQRQHNLAKDYAKRRAAQMIKKEVAKKGGMHIARYLGIAGLSGCSGMIVLSLEVGVIVAILKVLNDLGVFKVLNYIDSAWNYISNLF